MRVVHAAKDKILLEGNDPDYSDDGDEDEVFRLKGVDDDSEDEEYDDITIYEGDEGFQEVADETFRQTLKISSTPLFA